MTLSLVLMRFDKLSTWWLPPPQPPSRKCRFAILSSQTEEIVKIIIMTCLMSLFSRKIKNCHNKTSRKSRVLAKNLDCRPPMRLWPASDEVADHKPGFAARISDSLGATQLFDGACARVRKKRTCVHVVSMCLCMLLLACVID